MGMQLDKDTLDKHNEATYGEKELNESEKIYIEMLYHENYEKLGLFNILKNDKDANEYLNSLLKFCIELSITLNSTVRLFIEKDIVKVFEEKKIPVKDSDQFFKTYGKEYVSKIFLRFNEMLDMPPERTILVENNVGTDLLKMTDNTFNEAKRIINQYLKELKAPFSALNITVDLENMKPVTSDIDKSFLNSKSFTKLVNNLHGLYPLVQEKDALFFTAEEKLINLPFLRGLVSGHIKMIIIKSIHAESMIATLHNYIQGMSMYNEEGNKDGQINATQNMISFIEWANEYRKHIEYFDIAKYMNLSNDEIRSFAAKLSGNEGKTFKNNIDKLMNSEPHDLTIDKFINVTDDHDRLMLFGEGETNQ